LWYFASGQYHHVNSTEGGPTQREISPRIFLKLTSEATGNGVLQGWLQWDHTTITGRNADEFTPIEATTGEDNPEIVGNLGWHAGTLRCTDRFLFRQRAGIRPTESPADSIERFVHAVRSRHQGRPRIEVRCGIRAREHPRSVRTARRSVLFGQRGAGHRSQHRE